MTETDASLDSAAAQALPTFDDMPLSDDVKQALAAMGYTHPTPAQLATYDPAVRGADLVVQARTGTGKTAAFGLALIDKLIQRNLSAVQALVLTPTRELALQVSRELERIGQVRRIRNAAVYGGAPIQRQIDAIQSGVHIVVGTPGRVLDHLRRDTLTPGHIRILVLDESDEMLSMGFERELHAITDFLPRERQTLLFSATLPPEITRMATERLRNPQFLYLSGDHVGALDVVHFVYFVMDDKHEALLRVLETEDPESAIVFCNTREETERVAAVLTRAGFEADWLNGDLPQSDREKVMARTREGKLRFLVATDVAARGIDISHLTHVINFDFPDSAEQYVHRTGRTGRMGRTGTAISLLKPQDIGSLYYLRLTYKIRPFEKQLPTAGELKTRAETDTVQMLAQAYASAPQHPDDLALARRLLTHDECETIIAGLLRDHLGARPGAQEEAAAARRARMPQRLEASSAEAQEPAAVRTIRGRQRPSRLRTQPQEEPSASPAREEAPQPQEPSVQTAEPPRAPERIEMPRPPREAGPEPRGRWREGRRREGGGLPRYETAPLTQEVLESAGVTDAPAPASPPAATELSQWSPPPEENDDMPIFSESDEPDSMAPPSDIRPEDQAEVFVNVGRRDGARASDFLRVIDDTPGLSRDDVGRIRVRERHSFVVVRRNVLDRIVEALSGSRIGNRVASAELARPRDPGAASD